MWRDRRGESRSCKRGQEQALRDEESVGVTGGESGGVNIRRLLSLLHSPPLVMTVLNPSGKGLHSLLL